MKETSFKTLIAAVLSACATLNSFAQEVDMHNPVGVTGIFNGNVETGGSYDPLSHSSHRTIDDLVVPGSIGKYPLKMTRYYNSRARGIFGLGPGWRHEYQWGLSQRGSTVSYPNGNTFDTFCQAPVGVSDRWEGGNPAAGDAQFRLADGGTVVFANFQVTSIVDPYGYTTTIDYPDAATIIVTEPGGRYLKFIYTNGLLNKVEAHGLGNNTVTDSVNYNYTQKPPGGNGTLQWCLTGVTYSDGTTASYDYTEDNVQAQYKALPLLATASDKRYKGPMRQIAYDYQPGGPHGAITAERFNAGGTLVSRIDPGATLCSSLTCGMATDFTETRGDGPTRTFTYTHLNYRSIPNEPGCPETGADPPSQFLRSYTDFQGHRTWIGYDPVTWYITSVTDARGTQEGDPNYTTTYQRGLAIGEITKITHPDSSFIKYDYEDPTPETGDPHYVTRITDERGNVTKHFRDAKHRITRTEHRNPGANDSGALLAYETFTYCDQIDPVQCSTNPLGQIKTQRLKNGAYVHYAYNPRGLLTDKWEPTWTQNADTNEPKTHYDYYTSGPWADRLKTKTMPPNYPYNYQASETYEYETDVNGNHMGGRGLITKITHADNTYQTFGYDAYGNKLWEENELRNHTSYSYDVYNRVLSVINPLQKITRYTYVPTGGGSSYKHTTNNPDTVTTPVDANNSIVTKNVYDENFRKSQSTAAYQTPDAATTWFHYDNVGNPDYVTDPRGSSAPSAAWTTYTDFDDRNRKWRVREPLGRTTWFEFGDNINITKIHRADGTVEQKSYDGMNRIATDTVPKEQGVNIVTQFQYYPNNVQSAGLLQKVIDGENHPYQFEYDPSGMKTKLTYPDNSTQQWIYDSAHNLKSRTTVAGETQNFAYDDRNRKIEEWWDGWPADGEWRAFDYDDANHLRVAINGIGAFLTNFIADVRRQYDDAGRLSLDRQTVYVNGVADTRDVNYPSYDDDGRLLRMYVSGVSPACDYSFGYDDMGRLETIKPTGGSLLFQYSYDSASNQTQRYNAANHIAQNYVPDNLNRTTSVEVKNTTSNTQLGLESYDYYTIGRLHSVTRDDNKKDSFTYYLDGELQQATYGVTATPPPTPTPPPGGTPPGGTPPGGTPTPTATPVGQVAEPAFNPDGGTTNQHSLQVTISTTTAGAQIRYTKNDPTPPSRTYGTLINGNSGTITLSLGHVTLQAIAFKTGMTDSPIHSADYDYDNGGGPTGQNITSVPYPLDKAVNQFGQGPISLMLSTVTYTLDKAGNRQAVNGTSYSPNSINQYTSVAGNPVTNGSDHEIRIYGGFTYSYMRDQELTRISAPGLTYDVAYDALGRCVKRVVNNDPTYFIYDGDKPILEYKSNGQIARNLYGKGIDEILMRTDPAVNGGQAFYFQQDHEGSTTHLTNLNNGNGQIIERYRYDAFGAPTIYPPSPAGTPRPASSYNNRFLFTGREYSGAWVYEYRARVYHSGLGRFMSEDPKLFVRRAGMGVSPSDWTFGAHPDEADFNLFRYCGNDPIDFTDPTGLMPDAVVAEPEGRDVAPAVVLGHAAIIGVLAAPAAEAAVGRAAVAVMSRSPTLTRLVAAIAAASRAQQAATRTSSSSSAAKTGETVFWSGREGANRAAAEAFARSTGKTTLEMTPTGRALEAAGGNISQWKALSADFARSASGEVNAFAGGARPNSVWNTVEKPLLMQNPSVTKIIINDAVNESKTKIIYP